MFHHTFADTPHTRTGACGFPTVRYRKYGKTVIDALWKQKLSSIYRSKIKKIVIVVWFTPLITVYILYYHHHGYIDTIIIVVYIWRHICVVSILIYACVHMQQHIIQTMSIWISASYTTKVNSMPACARCSNRYFSL